MNASIVAKTARHRLWLPFWALAPLEPSAQLAPIVPSTIHARLLLSLFADDADDADDSGITLVSLVPFIPFSLVKARIISA